MRRFTSSIVLLASLLVTAQAFAQSGTVPNGDATRLMDGYGNRITSTGGKLDVNNAVSGASPTDNESNTNVSLSRIGSFTYVFDGAAWDRWTGAVTGTFWQATQPVSIASMPSTPVTGTFWQATQPVTGTFWQATQPVSIASMPSTPVTGSFWQATQPVSGTFWQATQPVSGAFFQSTQPVSIASMPSTSVTGTFWQATQPVSGTFFQATQPVSIASMPSTPVTGAFYQATQPVSGTFYQATQPVSIATMPSTPVTGTFYQATQPVSASSLPLPSNASQETGGNLASIATNTTGLATLTKQDTGNVSLASIDTKMPAPVLASQPTFVMASAVPIPPQFAGSVNNLQFAAGMQAYCRRVLCPPTRGGLR